MVNSFRMCQHTFDMLQVYVTVKCVSLCHDFDNRRGDINERIKLKLLHFVDVNEQIKLNFWRHQ
jgi:hypothetical protein